MLKIINIQQESIAEELGLEVGDSILHFNSDEDADILDYIYYDAEESFSVTVKKNDGGIHNFSVEKYADESLGLEFDESSEICTATCRNKCVFCFVDQLPRQLRETLYVKDDDYRLSFVTGNYVTLTNLSDKDIKKIVERKFSPLYISVHATDTKVRCKMLSNRFAGNILKLIKLFIDAGIVLHCQVVLCPGLNDGEILKKTIEDLYAFYPKVRSLAVVPVGLTKHREGLFPLKQVDSESAQSVIKLCENYAFDFVKCSDEMYLKANLQLPHFEKYGEFEQIENGVGLIRKFEHEFYSCFEDGIKIQKRKVNIVTGFSAYDFISKLVNKFCEKYNIDSIKVNRIRNDFFGDTITVAGLITGQDIVNQLKNVTGTEVWVPKVMLREFEDVFLDGMTLQELQNHLNADVRVCENYGYSFFDALAGY